jgi:spectinomycin phosphotransferase
VRGTLLPFIKRSRFAVNSEPVGFDRAALISVLGTWDLSIRTLTYLPVGAGSHHYLAVDSDSRRWFVTVDELLGKLFGMLGPTFKPWLEVDLDDALDVLNRAFRTTVALHQAGLEFVHAPVPRPDGEVLLRFGDYAASVFPYIEGISDTRDRSDRPRLLAALGRLHAATEGVPPGLPQRDTLTVPLKVRFLETLDDLRSQWSTGPYGEQARRLLHPRTNAIRELFHRCDELADAVRARGKPWVVTHGQMHSLNVVRTEDGRLRFVDWECVALAPRERDLGTWGNDLDPKTDEDWAAYACAGHPRDLDPTAMELYRHIGLLWGICADTELFRSPHVDNADTQHEWRNLQTALATIDELQS